MEIKHLDTSTFLEIMRDNPRNRILDFLISENGFDYTLKEIAEHSKVGYATIKRIWHHFVAHDLVRETRRAGKQFFISTIRKVMLVRKLKSSTLIFCLLQFNQKIKP